MRDILFYSFLLHVITRDIFITFSHPLEPHAINGRPPTRDPVDQSRSVIKR